MTPYYEADGIAIYHGDCAEIAPQIQKGTVALVMTSPPYNQMSGVPDKTYGIWGQTDGGVGFVNAWKASGYADDMPEDAYQAWQNGLFAVLGDACTADASLFYNHQLRYRDRICLHPMGWFHPEGWNFRQEIIRDRGGGMMFNARMFVRFDERILWFTRSPDRWTWNQERVGDGTIWRIAREQQQQGKLHPVQFPLEIPSRCIAAASRPGDVVLDPFMGSGTTLVAARNLGRRAVGIERERKYCDIAVRRLAQQTLDFGNGNHNGNTTTISPDSSSENTTIRNRKMIARADDE